MGRPKGWSTTMTGRAPMRSPGRPGISRDVQRLFWAGVAKGLTSEDAALACGVSPVVGTRWFRENGGMPQISLKVSGQYLSLAEREDISLMRSEEVGVREIARRLSRSASTISRELRRNAATRGGKLHYRASTAQWKAERQARRPKPAKLAVNERLRNYVQHRLDGRIEAPDGQTVPGPDVAWGGRRHGRRKDRRWATAWSPEQIAGRLRVDFPEDESMRISHEAIYQGLYVEGRGGLRRELTACLRTGRTLRKPRARAKRGKHFVSPEVRIDRRPQEAANRTVAGHWEGDLILGLGGTAIGTLVERATRFTMLLHLPPIDGHGTSPRLQERSSAGWPRRRSGARSDSLHDYRPARRAAPLPDLGPGSRDGPARATERDHGPAGLLLRPALTMATGQQREHQRTATAVLPQGYRSGPPQP